MQLWHLTFASSTRHTLFPSEAQRRAALSKVLRIAGAEIVLYQLVDDHLHLIVWCDEARRAGLLRSLRLGLRPLASTEIDAGHSKPVEGRAHLLALVRYFLLQVEKHGLAVHPALWTGSCFQDLAGARCVAPITARFASALPRARLALLQGIVGLPAVPIEPVSLEQVRRLGPSRLVEAAGSALLVGPDLVGNSVAVVNAKRVVAQLGAAAGLPERELSWALGGHRSGISRWKAAPINQRHARAVRIRLALEEIVALLPLRRAAGDDAR